MSQAGQFSFGTGNPPIETLTGDVGGAVPPDGVSNLDVLGGTNIGTVGNPGANSITINLDDSIQLPITNAAGTEGVYALGATALPGGYVTDRFLHNFGTQNTFIGSQAGNMTLGSVHNVGVGFQSLIANTTGNDNLAGGYLSATSLTDGLGNCALGSVVLQLLTSGDNNTAVGFGALDQLLTGDNNLALGVDAGMNYTGVEDSNIVIGNDGTIGDTNTIRIGTEGAAAGEQFVTFIAGIYQAAIGVTNEVVIIDDTGSLGSSKGLDGELLIGSTAGAPEWDTLASADNSITITNGANTIDLAKVRDIVWNEVVGAAQAMVVNNGYVANNAGLVTLTLPAAPVFGETIAVTGKGAGGWIIAQNAGQVIHVVGSTTTAGIGGSLASTAQFDAVELLCITAPTDWLARSSMGNLTII